jgi:hypothetical protein
VGDEFAAAHLAFLHELRVAAAGECRLRVAAAPDLADELHSAFNVMLL